jgi:hypothetical protein
MSSNEDTFWLDKGTNYKRKKYQAQKVGRCEAK